MSLWSELTNKQKAELGVLSMATYSLPFVYTPRNRTDKSLIRRGLATSWGPAEGLHWICLTSKGHALVRKKPPEWWITFIREHSNYTNVAHFIKQLPLEKLPEFLVRGFPYERYIAHTTAEKLLTQ